MYRVITIYQLKEGTDLADGLECIGRQISECMSVPHYELGADPDTNRVSLIADYETAADAMSWESSRQKRNISFELNEPEETSIRYYRKG
ncbi:MAG: hypothetical protein ACI4WR_02565 [Bulleidia sp.]